MIQLKSPSICEGKGMVTMGAIGMYVSMSSPCPLRKAIQLGVTGQKPVFSPQQAVLV
jgi:hypothetical protein